MRLLHIQEYLMKGDYYFENPSIGRVVVAKAERGKELGKRSNDRRSY